MRHTGLLHVTVTYSVSGGKEKRISIARRYNCYVDAAQALPRGGSLEVPVSRCGGLDMVGIPLAERQDWHGNFGEKTGGSKDCLRSTLYAIARLVMQFCIRHARESW